MRSVTYASFFVLLYVAGVAWCLLMSDARPAERIVLAICWPLGPLAFVVTVVILLGAAVIAYPVVMATIAVAAAALWWALL
jgi:hypothetical protein